MSYAGIYLDGDYLTERTISRRCVAWMLDVVLITILLFGAWLVLLLFGLLTLGFGFAAMALLPLVPFCYHLLSLLGRNSATPGQQMLGLTVRRDADLGPPTPLQALVSTLVFYVSLATSGLLLLVVFITTRHRTLHDLASGLVVVRVHALETLTAQRQGWNIGPGTSYR